MSSIIVAFSQADIPLPPGAVVQRGAQERRLRGMALEAWMTVMGAKRASDQERPRSPTD